MGQIFSGRYRIVRELGSGGFATVFLALDEKLVQKPVVVKVLDSVRGDAWSKRKFRQEIEALARIDHPGVVTVLDEGQTPQDTPFLVMQYIDGVTLRKLISPGGIDLARAGAILRQIGSALGAAHEKGVFHRDLKPENIMVQSADTDPHVKLIDFGIAGIKDSVFSRTETSTRVAGTYRYMPPEQLEGKVCQESDIFAFGAIAYELLTGESAIGSPMELLALRVNGLKVKPRERRPEIPQAAEAVIVKALRYEAAGRYRSAREVGDLLADSLAPARPAPPAPSRRGLLAGAAVAAILAAGGFYALMPHNRPAFEYAAMVRRGESAKPFQFAGETFEKGHEVSFQIHAARPGFFYVLDDAPMPDGSPAISVLLPSPGQSVRMAVGRPLRVPATPEAWFRMDEATGTEEVYLVWSSQPVPELETLKDRRDLLIQGQVVVREQTQIDALRRFFREHRAAEVKKDDDGRTTISDSKKVVAHLVRLKHD